MNKQHQTEQLIRVKKNLFETKSTEEKNDNDNFMRSLAQENVDAINSTDSSSFNQKEQQSFSTSQREMQESIVCSPELMQYINDSAPSNSTLKISQVTGNDGINRTKPNSYTNQALYELISRKFSESMCDDEKDNEGNFSMSPRNDADANALLVEEKQSIGGLFLRNPRGEKF